MIMLCPKCHSLLTKGAKYCDICGTRISQEDIQVEEVGSRVKNREKHKKEVRKKTKIIILGIIALVVVIAPFIIYASKKPSWVDPNSTFEPFHWEEQPAAQVAGKTATVTAGTSASATAREEQPAAQVAGKTATATATAGTTASATANESVASPTGNAPSANNSNNSGKAPNIPPKG